jgi:hypothetical protein
LGLTKAYQIAHDAEYTLTHAVPKLSIALRLHLRAVAALGRRPVIAAASVVTGTTIAAVKSLIKESDAIAKAKKAQFYFLYGTNELLGIV